jgi:deoxyribonuclease IV
VYLGAHISIAESIALAPARGRSVGCETIQIFSRSPRMLRKTKPIPPEEAEAFQAAMAKKGVVAAVIHANYLINLASPKKNGLRVSRQAFLEELERAQVLGLRDVIFHPGAHMGKGEAYALKTIAASLDWAFDHANAPDALGVLEITAGQGTVVGHTFGQLAEIIKGSSYPDRLAVCVDTCHSFAAGHDFRTRDRYEALLRTVDETVGLSRVRAFHLNDSKGDLGSRVDRHEDVGKGKLGREPFGFLVNDERFRTVPAVLEFPGTEGGYRRELKLLRSLVTGENPPTSPQGPRGRRAARGTASGSRRRAEPGP